MAVLGANNLTLSDITKRTDPKGRPSPIAELLDQMNGVLQDVTWFECNDGNEHQTTVRTSLPNSGTRRANEGVAPTKSTTAQAQEVTTIFEDWVTTDEIVAEKGGNLAENRLKEALPHAEFMGQNFTEKLFFGNHSSEPKDFNGFATRSNSLSGVNAENIMDAGGSGSDNSSIYLVGWGNGTVYGVYPEGTNAGIQHTDWGKQVVTDTAGGAGRIFAAYREQWQWQAGLSVEDWRYTVRIANIDISDLISKAAGAVDLFDFMIGALHRIPNLERVTPVFYMNRTVMQMLMIQARDDVIAGGGLTFENVDGRRIVSFQGAQIKLVDRLTETEAQVT